MDSPRLLLTASFSTSLLFWGMLGLAVASNASGSSWDELAVEPAPQSWLRSAVPLANGRILLLGGNGNDYSPLAFEYLPGDNRYIDVSSSMSAGYPIATLLSDGRVLVLGGISPNTADGATTSAIYSPQSRAWVPVPALSQGRFFGGVQRLLDGRVLAIGGRILQNGTSTASCEIFDPSGSGGSWTTSGSMLQAREMPVTARLKDGRILVAGNWINGFAFGDCELFDPASGTWTATAPMMVEGTTHTLTVLPNGDILAVGGTTTGGSSLASCERYSIATGTWAPVAMLTHARASHAAILLTDGRVLVTGGAAGAGPLTSCELYEPATDTWIPGPDLHHGRVGHLLITTRDAKDGRTFAFGGDASGTIATTEAFSTHAAGHGKNFYCGTGAGSASFLLSLALLCQGFLRSRSKRSMDRQ